MEKYLSEYLCMITWLAEFMKLLLGPITVDMELAFSKKEYFSVRTASSSRYMKEHKELMELVELVKQLEDFDPAFSQKMSYHFVMQHGLYVVQQLKLYHEQKKVMIQEPQQQQELAVASPAEEDTAVERLQRIVLARSERRLACAVCKHRGDKCEEDCEYERFFPQADTWKFLMLDKVYGLANVMRLLGKYDGDRQQEAFEDLVLYTEMHMQHPIYVDDRLLIIKAKGKTLPGAGQGQPLVRGHAPFKGQQLVGGYAPQQVFGRQQLVGGYSDVQLFGGQQLVGGYDAPQQQLVGGYEPPQVFGGQQLPGLHLVEQMLGFCLVQLQQQQLG